jgi:hypothetical protein
MKCLIYLLLAGLLLLLVACDVSTNDINGAVEPNSTPIPVQIIELKLPFKINHEPEGIMPMGETINHPPPMGHPGIDF